MDENKTELEPLTPKQKKFVDEYMIDFNGAGAARRAGYSESCAKEIASENLTKPNIQTEIAIRMKAAEISPEQITKMFRDIASVNANKYMKVVKVWETPRIKKGLAKIIEELTSEMDMEDEFCLRANLSGKDLIMHEKSQKRRRMEKIRLTLELEKDPKAFRVVDGKPVQVEDIQFDMVAIARDKEAGKIKSYKVTRDGPQVEFYGIDNALQNLARMHGMYKKDNDQLKPDAVEKEEIDYSKLSLDALKQIRAATTNRPDQD